MTDITSIMGGPFVPPITAGQPDSPEVQLRNAIIAVGLHPPADILLDGNIHRYDTGGQKDKGKTGWYVGFSDGVPAGMFGCWRSGLEHKWRADVGRELTTSDQMAHARRMGEAQRKRDEARRMTTEAVAVAVDAIWSSCAGALPEHPYLVTKGIQPHGSRVTGDGRLVVPIMAGGAISSLQYIGPGTNKKYHLNGTVKGSWCIGSPVEARTAYVAEGFATAASIHEATGQPCHIAYSDSNLPAVARMLRETLGDAADICIVGDHDTYTEDERSRGHKKGFEWAEIAAADARARVIHIPTEGDDANDYAKAGLDLRELLEPSNKGWLIPANEFCAEPAPIRWLIKGWVQRSCVMMVHGPSSGGKTFAVLDWCLTIAAGHEKWNGFRVNPGGVVYLAGEGHDGLKGRVAAWKHHHQADEIEMWLSPEGCDFNTPDGYRRVSDAIRALGRSIDLVVIDTLHCFLKGDENSPIDVRSMLHYCTRLMVEFGCTVILVHHTGHAEDAQDRGRGSSSWRGGLAMDISVAKRRGNQPMQLIPRKVKDGEEGDALAVELVKVAIPGWIDEEGEQVFSLVVVATDVPVPQKKPSKHDEDIRTVERAWWASGAEVLDGLPYISRSALRELLVKDGLADRTAANNTDPGRQSGLICHLLNAGTLEGHLHGWKVISPHYASAMLLRKSA